MLSRFMRIAYRFSLGTIILCGFAWLPEYAAATVVINEILYHPASLNDDDEFIELYNFGAAAVRLEGWRLEGGVRYTFPPNTVLEAGAHLLVTRAPQQVRQRYANAVVAGPYEGRLSNKGERVVLRTQNGEMADAVDYREELGWPESADGLGPSIERIHPQMLGSRFESWRAGPPWGTPGAANVSAVQQPRPIVFTPKQSPVVPSPQQRVHFTAEVIHSSTIAEAVLFFKHEDAASFNKTPLADDGLNDDGLADDGLYGGSIPPYAQGSIVEFFIEARDVDGVTGRFPAKAEQALAIYIVDGNSRDTVSNPLYRIIMRSEDNHWLRTRDPFSNQELESSFVFNNTIYYNVGTRFRGRGARGREPKSYRVNFSKTRLFGSIRKLNLNGWEPDRQFIGLETFRVLGMPVAEKQPVSLLFNLSFFPRYLQVERADQDMLERLYQENAGGNLYRGDQQANLDYRGESFDAYRPHYLKSTNELEDDFSDIAELAYAFSETNQREFPQAVSNHIDLPQWLRWFAIKQILNDREGGLSLERGDDYYLYNRPDTGRFELIPWDMDSVIVEPIEPVHHHRTPAVRRLLRHPEITRMYFKELLDLLRYELPVERLDAIIERAAPVSTPERMQWLKGAHRRIRASIFSDIPEKLTLLARAGAGKQKSLVGSGDVWKFFRGRAQPAGGNFGWIQPGYDDSTWESGPGGFGYGQGTEGTALLDMKGQYTSVLLRKQFQVPSGRRFLDLTLGVDYDDGFIAFLNGTEVARSYVFDPPRFDILAARQHDAQPPTPEFFVNADLLRNGTNTLAVFGVNRHLHSFDMLIDPKLSAREHSDNALLLSGQAPAVETESVLVNGKAADYTPWRAFWQYPADLQTGLNRFKIQAVDSAGAVVDTTEFALWHRVEIRPDQIFTHEDMVWNRQNSPIELDRTVVIGEQAVLRIEAGVEVRLASGAGLVVRGGVVAEGTEDNPIVFRPMQEDQFWGAVILDRPGQQDVPPMPDVLTGAEFFGAGGMMFGREHYQAVVNARMRNLAVESCRIHHSAALGIDVIDSTFTVKNSHFEETAEGIRVMRSLVEIRENTFKNIRENPMGVNAVFHADAIDLDFCSNPANLIQNNRFESIDDDGIDTGNTNATIAGNRIFSCKDKGLSLEGGSEINVFNNVVQSASIGIAVKDRCHARIIHNTVYDVNSGVRVFEKNAGLGGGTAYVANTVVWKADEAFFADALSQLEVESSNGKGADAFGMGNLMMDPRFIDPQNGDLRLSENSPLIDAGRVTEVNDDLNGMARNHGKAPDIGAFESSFTTAVRHWRLHSRND